MYGFDPVITEEDSVRAEPSDEDDVHLFLSQVQIAKSFAPLGNFWRAASLSGFRQRLMDF